MDVSVQGDIADEEFSQYFSQFGDIEDCVVSIAAHVACGLHTHVLPVSMPFLNAAKWTKTVIIADMPKGSLQNGLAWYCTWLHTSLL